MKQLPVVTHKLRMKQTRVSKHSHSVILTLNLLICLVKYIGTSSPKKKTEKDKRSKEERAMDRTVESFMSFQKEAEERFQKSEEERWEKEVDIDDKRQREERDHEIRLFQMLGQMIRPRENYPNTYPPSSCNYDFEY